MKRKRPLSVTFLALAVLTLTGWHGLRLILLWKNAQWLSGWTLSTPLKLLEIFSLLWGVVGLLLVIGLWRGKVWLPKAILIATLAYIGFIWMDHWILSQTMFGRANLPFLAVCTVLGVWFIWWTIFRSGGRNYFGERHE